MSAGGARDPAEERHEQAEVGFGDVVDHGGLVRDEDFSLRQPSGFLVLQRAFVQRALEVHVETEQVVQRVSVHRRARHVDPSGGDAGGGAGMNFETAYKAPEVERLQRQ